MVIRIWDWSETSQTVSLFTREHGMLRGVAKGSRREKGRFSGGFDLLTRGQVMAIVKPASDLALITEWDLQETFPAVRASLRAHYAAMHFADLIQKFVREADPHPRLWDALHSALRGLRSDDDPGGLVAVMQWATLTESGFAPDLTSPPGGADTLGFDPAAGRLVPDPGPAGIPGAPPWRVRAQTVATLRAVATAAEEGVAPEPGQGGAGAPLREALDRASRLLGAYCEWVLGRDLPTLAALFPQSESAPPRPLTRGGRR